MMSRDFGGIEEIVIFGIIRYKQSFDGDIGLGGRFSQDLRDKEEDNFLRLLQFASKR
jgi:hypothetical protein